MLRFVLPLVLLGLAAQAQALYGPGVPETGRLTCRAGHYTVPFVAEQAWTIGQIAYDDKVFSGGNGFHGTVLVPQGGKFIGTGHADGGREVVEALKLTVDGQERAVQAGITVTGHIIVLRKASTIWKLRAVAEVTLTDDYVLQRTTLQATEDCNLALMYYFMHCFVPTTTRWLACLPNGTLEEGSLGVTDSFLVNKDTRWLAEYEPNWRLGLLTYTPRVIAGPGSCSMIWDKRNYHKYYLRSNQARSLRAGEVLDYSVVVQAVPHENGDWSATKAAAERLAKQFPPVTN